MKTKLQQTFRETYGHQPTISVRAPARVNLIGEHTDYNGGWVLPMAIDSEVLIAASPRSDTEIHIIAPDQGQAKAEFSLFDIKPVSSETWSNYPRGVVALLKRNGFSFPGFNAAITGNIPIGAGLSSSAALLVATATLVQALGRFSIDKVELAKLCQKAENLFCGVQSGIMDQFIITLAETGHALLIDCFNLSYQQIPLPKGCSILICNTMKSRELSDSAYNNRRSECSQALTRIEEIFNKNFNSLRQVSLLELSQAEKNLPITLFKRAKHVISENARVLAAVNAAQIGDLAGLGNLMNESHDSLQSLYDVSSPELDTMVNIARKQPGVFGARLTGAGFGGCTVNLVSTTYVQSVSQTIKSQYYKQTGITPEIYLATAQSGASLV